MIQTHDTAHKEEQHHELAPSYVNTQAIGTTAAAMVENSQRWNKYKQQGEPLINRQVQAIRGCSGLSSAQAYNTARNGTQ